MTAPHLDDEQLSAILDEGDPDLHLASCAPCSARLDDLTSARSLLAAAPDPLAPGLLDAMLARALDALEESQAPVAAPVDLRDRRARRRPPPSWLLSAAAAIAVLAGVAGLLQASDRNGSGAGLTALDAERATGGGATADAGATEESAAPVSGADPDVVGGDLGDQSDPAVLTALLQGAAAGGGTANGPSLSTTSKAVGAEDFGRQTSPGQAESDAPVVAGSPAAGSATAASPAPPSTIPPDRARCRAEAERIGAGRLGGLASTSSVRWKGEPAEVLVYFLTEPAGGFSRQALVLSRPGCALLADPRF